jgi:hypothetical protein
MTSSSLAHEPVHLSSAIEDLAEIACPGCGDTLEIHQPDPRKPDRLLGTCCSCGAWFLIDAAADLIARLPEASSPADVPRAFPLTRCDADLKRAVPAGTSSRSGRSGAGVPRVIG